MSYKIKSYDEFREADSFFNVSCMETRTSVSKVELPMLFNNAAVRQLNYFIEPARVDPLLKDTGFIPCRFFNGKCIVSLIFYNYRDVTETVAPLSENEVRAYITYVWSTLHGYIAGINNEILNYMHHNPGEMQDMVLENIYNYIQQEIEGKRKIT